MVIDGGPEPRGEGEPRVLYPFHSRPFPLFQPSLFPAQDPNLLLQPGGPASGLAMIFQALAQLDGLSLFL